MICFRRCIPAANGASTPLRFAVSLAVSVVEKLGTPVAPQGETARWKKLLTLESPHRRILLLPEQGKPFAYWSIDPATGEVIGAVEDGSGAGQSDANFQRQLEELEETINYLNLLAAVSGGGVAIGVVANYGQFLARLYAAVSLVIINLDAATLDDAIRAAVLELSCNLAKTIFGGFLGGPGSTFGTLDAVLSLLIEDNPFSCPS